ncbi:NAD-dependent epimerase/dehydratase family protein [Paenibacillus sp. CF384]|uniref:NAD-dependent epimerase/dehydratase family protein n=1 Tax=Paenibacillus sp. CF384 TaxID=1884382 RepID=UPI00089A9F29|nr:NAD-dependent epimerase/dehydratase family protein [Paenibacillus sp. CF384]SDX26840.1 UDP-glucose 4-epimerase [Paenibacillus sp. CF384]
MIRVLVTGTNSYVGKSLERYLGNLPDMYTVDTISLRDNDWKKTDFSIYDVIVHTVGVAHIKENKKNAELYFKVNCELAHEVAKKAKNDGVNQFIFLSSMSVYGTNKGIIDRTTPTNPNSNYGKSKLQAEQLIGLLASDDFRVAILRPPMIYGKGCKGNYVRLSKLAISTPIFPNVDNKRSMIYIDNLTEFLKSLIDSCSSGLFFPQNNEYINTSDMVRTIAEIHGKKIWMTRLFNPVIKVLNHGVITKIFGDLVYDHEMKIEAAAAKFNQISFYESIRLTEE